VEARIWSEDPLRAPHVEVLRPGHVGVVGAGKGHALAGEPLQWRPRVDEAPAVELVLGGKDLIPAWAVLGAARIGRHLRPG
jgi:hypothetical protein